MTGFVLACVAVRDAEDAKSGRVGRNQYAKKIATAATPNRMKKPAGEAEVFALGRIPCRQHTRSSAITLTTTHNGGVLPLQMRPPRTKTAPKPTATNAVLIT